MFIFYSITRVVCISQAKIVFYLTQLEAELAFTILEKGFYEMLSVIFCTISFVVLSVNVNWVFMERFLLCQF